MKLIVKNLNHVPYTVNSVAQMWRLLKDFRTKYEANQTPYINAVKFPERVVDFITGGYHFILQDEDGEAIMKVGFKLGANGKLLFPILFDAKKASKGGQTKKAASMVRTPAHREVLSKLHTDVQFAILNKMERFGTIDKFMTIFENAGI